MIIMWKKTAVKAIYIDKETGKEIEVAEEIEGYQGDEYTTEAKDIEGYKLEKIPVDAEGEMGAELIEVRYYYSKVSAPIVIPDDPEVPEEPTKPTEPDELEEKEPEPEKEPEKEEPKEAEEKKPEPEKKAEEPKQEEKPKENTSIKIEDDKKKETNISKANNKDNKANKVLPYTGINYALLFVVAGLAIFLISRTLYLKLLIKETDEKQENLDDKSLRYNLVFPNVKQNSIRNPIEWHEKEGRMKK